MADKNKKSSTSERGTKTGTSERGTKNSTKTKPQKGSSSAKKSEPSKRTAAPKKNKGTVFDRISGFFEGRKTTKNKKKKNNADDKKKLFTLVALIVIVLIIIITAAASKNKKPEDEITSEISEEEIEVVLHEVPISEILHLSFGPISVDESGRTLMLSELTGILNDLYERGYVLIDADALLPDKNPGRTVSVPEGKKPLILSQKDVSYPFLRQGSSYASIMTVNGNGEIACRFTDRSNKNTTGVYDFVPLLEEFIAAHPDFSYDNARGIIGLTGYNGILGYRTTTYLGSTENNPYAAVYGTFDTSVETDKAESVVKVLKLKNWNFACCGFDEDVSYGSESAVVTADAAGWINEVGSIVGECPYIIFPNGTDIGSWKPYSEDNAKYASLSEMGFKAFFTDSETIGLIQKTDSYVRQGIVNINSTSDYTRLFEP